MTTNLERGSTVNSLHFLCSGCTPLHIAAREKNLIAVMKLVDAGADVNKKDTSLGRTVLHVAVEEGSVEITEYLLQKVRGMLTELVYFLRDY